MHGMRHSLLHNMFLCSVELDRFSNKYFKYHFPFSRKKTIFVMYKRFGGFLYMLGSFVAGLLAFMSILCTNLKQEKSFLVYVLLCSYVVM